MKAWQITLKDLRLLGRDRRAVVVLVLFPLVFITILGITTGQLMVWGDDVQRLRIAVVDNLDYEKIGKVTELLPAEEQETAEEPEKKTEPADAETAEEGDEEEEPDEGLSEEEIQQKRKQARRLVAKIINKLRGRNGLKVTLLDDPEQAREQVEDNEVRAAVVIGPNFFNRVESLRPKDIMAPEEGRLSEGLKSFDIELTTRSSFSVTGSIIDQLVFADTLRSIATHVLCKNNFLERRFLRATCEALHAELEEPLSLEPIPEPEPQGTSDTKAKSTTYQEIIPSYTVMFVFFLVNIMARSFILERELGTLRRLRIAPIGPAALLVGKTVPFFVVSLIQSALLFVCGKILFDMSWGNAPWMLVPVVICTSVAATALGLLIATLVRTDAQVSAWANFIVITMAAISGCLFPRDWLPPLLLKVSLATPHAWALDAYEQIFRRIVPNMTTIWGCCAMLLVFAMLFFVVGCWRFSRLD